VQNNPSDSKKIFRKPVVLQRVPVSGTTIWRMVRDGEFPAPLRLSKNTVGWLESDIEAWIEQRASR